LELAAAVQFLSSFSAIPRWLQSGSLMTLACNRKRLLHLVQLDQLLAVPRGKVPPAV